MSLQHREMGRRSAEARGLPYYGEYRKNYPIHFKCFSNIFEHGKRYSLSTDLKRDLDGFKQFISIIGPVPDGMVKPTVGRKDHTKGYIYGNYAWQSSSDNTKEMMARTANRATKIASIAAAISPNRTALLKSTCPHCNKTGNQVAMHRWHFNNCKYIK